MKASELLTLALTKYENSSYMCHELEHCANDGTPETRNALALLDDKIYWILRQHHTIVLHNVLRYTNKKYEGYSHRYGWSSNVCYKMRVVFWQDMIAELKAEGL